MKRFLCTVLSASLLVNTVAFAGPLSQEQKKTILASFAKGESAWRQEPAHDTLDEKTTSDLELRADQTLMKFLMAIAPTPLGKKRIQWLLTHPYLETNEIHRRQQAVKYLVENPEILKQLHYFFEQFKKSFQTADFHSHFEDTDLLRKNNTLDRLHSIMVALIWGFALFGSGGLADFLMPLMLGVFSLQVSNVTRAVIMEAHGSLSQARKIGQALRNSSVPLLEELSALCSMDGACPGSVEIGTSLGGSGGIRATLTDLTTLGPALRMVSRSTISTHQDKIARLMGALADIESLYAAAMLLTASKESMVLPTVEERETPFLEVDEGHHTYLRLSPKQSSIANDVRLSARPGDNRKLGILTGPNAGGKTTHLRMMAITQILAQAGFPVTAERVALSPKRIITNFTNIGDSTYRGASTFMGQSKRVAEVFAAIQSNEPFLLLADEILTGTSKGEHRSAERAVFESILRHPNVVGVLATHDRQISQLQDALPGVFNIHVIRQGHKISEGPSKDYNAFDVMEAQGVPTDVIRHARDLFGKCESILNQ